ncbi:hypothetical protein [uncultured Pseudoteredinibacter sp.]|uniref:hypothetical protein n=1 Tax=uncultured Pseudoteredinibacter sp. TaxID=1641701 RepID=UPI0026159654|nr:hypothetical protein [uncultured Pseudoteredinibacter sp.]
MKKLLYLVLIFIANPFHAVGSEIINEPDKFAWQLFIELNLPAAPNKRGVADSSKKLGDEGNVVWETWALADDVFTRDGCKPSRWDDLKLRYSTKSERMRSPVSKADLIFSQLNEDDFQVNFDPNEPFSETRMNQAAFDFIRNEGLYNIEGQEAFHTSGRFIDLPEEAREIKSAWRVLTKEEIKSGRYHMNKAGGETYGLIALHIITKDIPQWFWSTFEHVDNPDIDIRDTENDLRWFDRHTNGGEKSRLPKEVIGTKWENYRLKGTQLDFVTLDGRPTIVANAIIERGFMGSSSCVSCHAHATIGDPINRCDPTKDKSCKAEDIRANRLPIFEDIRRQYLDPTNPKSKSSRFILGWTGTPNPELFYDKNAGALISETRSYTQTDFMWSFFRAKSKHLCNK